MPRSSPVPALGRLELMIMQVLWRYGSSSARQITDRVNELSARPVAHSTVQTILRKMEAKNAIGHHADGRQFEFHPFFTESEITQSATNDLLSRIFQGSAFDLVAHLLREEKIAPEERQRLRELIDAKEREEKGNV